MPTVFCPHCNARGQVSRGHIGRKVKCPTCGVGFFADDGTEPALTVQPVKKKRHRLLLAAGVGVCLFFCCAGVGGLLNTKPTHDISQPQPVVGREANGQLARPQPAAPQPQPARPSAAQRVRENRKLPRDEFRQLITGMTSEQLIEAIGRPDYTQEIEDLGPLWYYRDVALDPFTGKMSGQVQIQWRAPGVVGEVNFD